MGIIMGKDGKSVVVWGNLIKNVEKKEGNTNGKDWALYTFTLAYKEQIKGDEERKYAHLMNFTSFDSEGEKAYMNFVKGDKLLCYGELAKNEYKGKTTYNVKPDLIFSSQEIAPIQMMTDDNESEERLPMPDGFDPVATSENMNMIDEFINNGNENEPIGFMV